MNALVTIQDGALVTTSVVIAEHTGVQHQAFIKLVRKYLGDLEAFGRVGFSLQPFDTAGGRQVREIATLNEQQATMAIAFMRNSEIVRSFKIALVKKFFEMRAELTSPTDRLEALPPEQRALVAAMVENAEIKRKQAELAAKQVEHSAALQQIDQRVTTLAETMQLTERPQNSESIAHIRERINKLYGLPPRIVDYVMRQAPNRPTPAGMVKNSHENAQGSSYAVWWTTDVNATFRRFVSECKQVTQTQATHPEIDGRFKLDQPVPQPTQ